MPAASKTPEPLICPKCGDQWPDGQFCRRCGASLLPPEPEKPNTRYNLLRLLIVVIPVAVWWMFFHHPTTPTAPPDEPIKISPTQSGVIKQAVRLAALAKVSSAQEVYEHSAPSIATLYQDDPTHKSPTPIAAAFLIDNSMLATTAHSIQGVTNLSAHFSNGSRLKVLHVLSTDAGHDLALLRIEDTDAPSLPLGSSTLLAKGDKVLAIGAPDGLHGSVAQGSVKSIEGHLLLTNLPVEASWSGGPLLTMRGEVIGILTTEPPPALKGARPKDQHLALPVEWANQLLNSPVPLPAQIVTTGPPSANAVLLTASLGAHDHRSFVITAPRDFDPAYFTATFVNSGNLGSDFTVKLLQGVKPVYDSSTSIDADLKLKLKPGSYTVDVTNNATVTRDFIFSGHFSAAP